MALTDNPVAPFKQREYVAQSAADVQYGMCVGYSATWLVRHRSHKSEGPTGRINFIKNQARATAERAQRAYLAARTPADGIIQTGQAGAITRAFQEIGLNNLDIKSTNHVKHFSIDKDNAVNDIFNYTSGTHNYFFIMLSFGTDMTKATDDNHAIAAYHSGGTFKGWRSHLYVFEPNFGEFKLAVSEIKTFFIDLAAAYINYKDKSGKSSPKKLQIVTIHRLSLP